MTQTILTKGEKAGLVVRPLRRDVQDRFRSGAAGRQLTQSQYLERLLDLADSLRNAAALHDDKVSASATLDAHGLGRVTL